MIFSSELRTLHCRTQHPWRGREIAVGLPPRSGPVGLGPFSSHHFVDQHAVCRNYTRVFRTEKDGDGHVSWVKMKGYDSRHSRANLWRRTTYPDGRGPLIRDLKRLSESHNGSYSEFGGNCRGYSLSKTRTLPDGRSMEFDMFECGVKEASLATWGRDSATILRSLPFRLSLSLCGPPACRYSVQLVSRFIATFSRFSRHSEVLRMYVAEIICIRAAGQ